MIRGSEVRVVSVESHCSAVRSVNEDQFPRTPPPPIFSPPLPFPGPHLPSCPILFHFSDRQLPDISFMSISLLSEMEMFCWMVPLTLICPFFSLKLRVLWGLKVLPMKRVVPDLQLQVEASPEGSQFSLNELLKTWSDVLLWTVHVLCKATHTPVHPVYVNITCRQSLRHMHGCL